MCRQHTLAGNGAETVSMPATSPLAASLRYDRCEARWLPRDLACGRCIQRAGEALEGFDALVHGRMGMCR